MSFLSFVSDLFKKKDKQPVQKTPKTRADLEEPSTVRYKETNDKLQKTFIRTRAPNSEEKKQLQDVLNIIESVPDGKKLIADIAAAGYKINFDTFCNGAYGACNPIQKTIILSLGHLPDNNAALAAFLYHEMTHAMQDERSGGLMADASAYKMSDQIKFLRAAEASAWMEEAKFTYQIKDAHPEVLKVIGAYPMYQKFASEMEKTGDLTKASEATFKSWYGFKEYQGLYEEEHINIIKHKALGRLKKQDAKAFRQTMSSEDVLKYTLISENVSINPEFLTTPEAFSVSDNAIRSFKAISKGYASKFLTAAKDTSLDNMYSSETGKPLSGMEAVSKKGGNSLMSELETISKKQTAEKAAFAAAKGYVR